MVINLRSGNDVHALVGVLKRRIKSVSTQEEAKVEEELQQPTFQPTYVNNQATTSVKNSEPAIIEEDVVVPATSV